MLDIPASKQALRRSAVECILSLDPARRALEERELVARFPALPGFASAGCVLLYASAFPEEIDTGAMLQLALKQGKTLVCPRVDRTARQLRLYQIKDIEADFIRSRFGIPEPRKTCKPVTPEEVDWVLAPGLVFDHRGYRLGRGAGHYDRLLPTLRNGVPRWALGFDCQWVDELPVEPHDVPLDGVVSPSRTIVRAHSF